MKIKDLIAELSKNDPEMEVLVEVNDEYGKSIEVIDKVIGVKAVLKFAFTEHPANSKYEILSYNVYFEEEDSKKSYYEDRNCPCSKVKVFVL